MLGEDLNSRRLRKALIEEYPYLQPRNVFTGKIPEDYDYEYILGEHDLPEGWFELFLQMCEDLREPLAKADYLDKFRFSQIKEKFGSMRAYTFGATREVQNIIAKYEFLSTQVCCVCSKPATVQTYDWICPYCFEHVKDSNENLDDCTVIDHKTSYTRRVSSAGVTTETTIDCTDEWNRYLARINYQEGNTSGS